MNLIPWKNKQSDEPSRGGTLAALRTDVDRLFDTFFREPLGNLEWPFGDSGRWSPAVDVAETDQEVTVRAEVPGIEPGQLDVTLTGRQLVLSGEKKESFEKSGKDFRQVESRYGSFRRTIPLPETIDPDKVSAEFAHGVLTIRVPKSPVAPPKQIQVQVGGNRDS
ncbi:MAG: Hsp20/alpha crystallin family protein [Pirellulales bacterium]|nr:Hsp20/alpha crystallin family protein [Pirellulales bacterium]